MTNDKEGNLGQSGAEALWRAQKVSHEWVPGQENQSSCFSLAPIPGFPSVPLTAKDSICRGVGIYTLTLPRAVWLCMGEGAGGAECATSHSILRPWLPALPCCSHATVSFWLAGTWMIKFPALQSFFFSFLSPSTVSGRLPKSHTFSHDWWLLSSPLSWEI